MHSNGIFRQKERYCPKNVHGFRRVGLSGVFLCHLESLHQPGKFTTRSTPIFQFICNMYLNKNMYMFAFYFVDKINDFAYLGEKVGFFSLKFTSSLDFSVLIFFFILLTFIR